MEAGGRRRCRVSAPVGGSSARCCSLLREFHQGSSVLHPFRYHITISFNPFGVGHGALPKIPACFHKCTQSFSVIKVGSYIPGPCSGTFSDDENVLDLCCQATCGSQVLHVQLMWLKELNFQFNVKVFKLKWVPVACGHCLKQHSYLYCPTTFFFCLRLYHGYYSKSVHLLYHYCPQI